MSITRNFSPCFLTETTLQSFQVVVTELVQYLLQCLTRPSTVLSLLHLAVVCTLEEVSHNLSITDQQH
jgi:hypothetical protein